MNVVDVCTPSGGGGQSLFYYILRSLRCSVSYRSQRWCSAGTGHKWDTSRNGTMIISQMTSPIRWLQSVIRRDNFSSMGNMSISDSIAAVCGIQYPQSHSHTQLKGSGRIGGRLVIIFLSVSMKILYGVPNWKWTTPAVQFLWGLGDVQNRTNNSQA